MPKENEDVMRVCWACKTILVEDSKLGLCPKCVNRYGSPVAGVLLFGLGLAGRQLWKNGGKIIKAAVDIAKNIKP